MAKSTIIGPFSIAMLVYQRVSRKKKNDWSEGSTPLSAITFRPLG